MIQDQNISATSVTSGVLWGVGLALVVIGGFADLWFVGAGLWLSGLGGVFSIRRMFCRQAKREVAAFELGRECEKQMGIHSV